MRPHHRGSTWGGSTTFNACVELRRYHCTPVREAHLLLSSEAPSTPELSSISGTWGKLQMALASGAQHMNVLACDPNTSAQPSGGTPLPASAVLTGSTALQIVLGAGAVAAFAA